MQPVLAKNRSGFSIFLKQFRFELFTKKDQLILFIRRESCQRVGLNRVLENSARAVLLAGSLQRARHRTTPSFDFRGAVGSGYPQ